MTCNFDLDQRVGPLGAAFRRAGARKYAKICRAPVFPATVLQN